MHRIKKSVKIVTQLVIDFVREKEKEKKNLVVQICVLSNAE